MTFTYDEAISEDKDLVRFHIGDTSSDGGHYLEDETINYFITNSSVNEAVLSCIRYIITQLSTPNFTEDWLSVDNKTAREGFEKILKDKADEFGINVDGLTATSSVTLPTRSDSYQDGDDVYDGAP